MSHRSLVPSGRPRAGRWSRPLCGLFLCALWACASTPESAEPEALPSAAEGPSSMAAPVDVAESADAPSEPQAATPEGELDPSATAKPKVAPKRADLALEVEKKLREVDVATLELSIAERKARSEEASALAAVAAATREHGAAARALQHHSKFEKLVLLAEAQLKIDRAAFELEEEQQELAQMQREYGKYENDEHAVETGKIVVARGLKKIEFLRRSLDLEIGKRKALAEFTIPEKIAQLGSEVAKKADAMARAEEALERTSFEAELMVTKAKNKLSLARLEQARAEERLAKAK